MSFTPEHKYITSYLTKVMFYAVDFIFHVFTSGMQKEKNKKKKIGIIQNNSKNTKKRNEKKRKKNKKKQKKTEKNKSFVVMFSMLILPF